MPFGAHDRSWLLLRIILLALALLQHPLPFDLHSWGLVIPPHARTIAFIAFETLQIAVFAWGVFFWDTLPGLRPIAAYVRAIGVEARGTANPMATVLRKGIPFALALSGTMWLILTPLEIVRDAFPPGAPRFYAATAFFVLERLVIIVAFLIAVDAGSDDDPRTRRRNIAKSFATIFRLGNVRPATVPSAASNCFA